ncbi:MAG: type II pantothenate kinase [Ruminococcaceae bacterium]|nr:type II pantothenate kinase [Oscillospiraceae bacterium]
MKVIIGIDVGGSTTKIVGFRGSKVLGATFVHAADPITSLYGAFGKFTVDHGIELGDIEKVIVTGAGSSYVKGPLYGLPCVHESEFSCVGRGGLYLSGLSEAVIISMGTGTALVHAKKDGDNVDINYLGGTGVGGGTLIGLSKKLIGMENIDHIVEAAKTGNLDNIDLRISDIAKKTSRNMPLPNDMTAANFGKVSDIATSGDIALGVINMVFETIGMIGMFASRNAGTKNIVLTGNMTSLPQAKEIFENLNKLFDLNFIIPENAVFATAHGAALSK